MKKTFNVMIVALTFAVGISGYTQAAKADVFGSIGKTMGKVNKGIGHVQGAKRTVDRAKKVLAPRAQRQPRVKAERPVREPRVRAERAPRPLPPVRAGRQPHPMHRDAPGEVVNNHAPGAL